jgi:NitT/TauT family transport system substrate-binding protein
MEVEIMRTPFSSLPMYLCALIMFLALASAAGAAQEVKIAIPSFTVQYLPAVVAEEKGFYKQEDLDVKLVLMRGANETILALNGGYIDFVMAIGPAVPLINKGSDIKFLSQQVGEVTFSLLVRPDIKNIKELVGKSIGVSFGGTTYTGTIAVLNKLGFNAEKDFRYLNIRGSSPKLAALQQGIIDAAPLSVPEDIRAVRGGFKRLLYYGETLNNVAFTGLATSGTTIKTKPEIVKKVVRAVVKGVYHTRDNREDAVAVIMKKYKADRAMAEESYDLIRKSFSPVPTEEGVRLSAELELGKFEEKVPPSQYMDLHFLNEVLKELKKK